MPKRVYIAGPMSGLSEFNYPAFFEAEDELLDLGFEVENPARTDLPKGTTWEQFMKAGISRMLTCQMVALLPGWDGSVGARLERLVAVSCGLEVVELDELVGKFEADDWAALVGAVLVPGLAVANVEKAPDA